MNFRDWVILAESVSPQQIINAAMIAKEHNKCDRNHFSGCKAVVDETLSVLKRAGIEARISSGTFITKSKNESWDHSWLIVMNRWVLDPAIDQFKNDSRIDTKTSGIYYSHPAWDGNKYKDKYFRAKPIATINLGNQVKN